MILRVGATTVVGGRFLFGTSGQNGRNLSVWRSGLFSYLFTIVTMMRVGCCKYVWAIKKAPLELFWRFLVGAFSSTD